MRDSASRLLEKEVLDIEHMIRKLQLEMARQTAEILRLEQVVWRRRRAGCARVWGSDGNGVGMSLMGQLESDHSLMARRVVGCGACSLRKGLCCGQRGQCPANPGLGRSDSLAVPPGPGHRAPLAAHWQLVSEGGSLAWMAKPRDDSGRVRADSRPATRIVARRECGKAELPCSAGPQLRM